MASKKTKPIIKVPTNNGFYGASPDSIDINIDNEFEPKSQKALAKLIRGDYSSLIIDNAEGFTNYGYQNINTISFRKFSNFSEPRTIYEVRKAKGQYYLNTGLYIGFINVNDIRIEINTGYSDSFLKRMLNVANNIFFDSSFQENVKENQTEDLLSAILEYLFLSSFKTAFAMGLPSHYKHFEEKGLNVKGNLDVKKYILKDMAMGGYQVPYSYNQRICSQGIIDVLYLAMKCLDVSNEKRSWLDGDFAKYYRHLKQLYSGKVVSRNAIRRIGKDKSLNNPMYSKYKRVLKYARYILEFRGIIYEDENEKTRAPGFLLDISELWEIYLAKIISNRFTGYKVSSQIELPLYKDAFFARSNQPDIVMESEDSIVILDAKFKKMNFKNSDVDRNDLHQIHSYAGYYITEAKKAVKLCALIYPTADDGITGTKQISTSLFGIQNASTKFSIGYIKIGKTYQEMIENENAFLDRLCKEIEIPTL